MAPAAVVIIATVISAAASAYAAYSSGQAQKKAREYSAKVAEQQGAVAQESAEAEAEDRRRRARYLLGEQLATAGASGVALEGSPLLAMVDSAVQEDLEARRIQYRGYLAAVGYGSQAGLARYEGQQAARAGYIGAGTSLLRGGTSAYVNYQSPGSTTYVTRD